MNATVTVSFRISVTPVAMNLTEGETVEDYVARVQSSTEKMVRAALACDNRLRVESVQTLRRKGDYR